MIPVPSGARVWVAAGSHKGLNYRLARALEMGMQACIRFVDARLC